MLPIRLLDVAQTEFDQAFDWYEAQRSGLGPEFAEEVQKSFDRIANNPRRYRIAQGDVRKGLVQRFPYCVYYRPHADRIEVLAVFHTSRDPSIWQSRV